MDPGSKVLVDTTSWLPIAELKPGDEIEPIDPSRALQVQFDAHALQPFTLVLPHPTPEAHQTHQTQQSLQTAQPALTNLPTQTTQTTQTTQKTSAALARAPGELHCTVCTEQVTAPALTAPAEIIALAKATVSASSAVAVAVADAAPNPLISETSQALQSWQAATESPLPPEWRQAIDASGRVYFYHRRTRKTQWERPTWSASSAQPAPPATHKTHTDGIPGKGTATKQKLSSHKLKVLADEQSTESSTESVASSEGASSGSRQRRSEYELVKGKFIKEVAFYLRLNTYY